MNDERWLVKSSGRILGPFTLEELIQHLRARTLSIIDEIRDSDTRWGFVRDHIMFREIVRQLRDEDDSNPEATQSTFVSSSQRTTTLSVTETLGDGELTPHPAGSGAYDEARPITAMERAIKPVLGGSSSYGAAGDARIERELRFKRVVFMIFAWVIAGGLLTFAYEYMNQRKVKIMAKDQARQFLQLAHEQARFGQYAKALEFLEKAAGDTSLSTEDQILRAQLLVQVEGRASDGLRALSEVRSVTDARLVREMNLAKSLVYMKDQRWNEATLELNSLLSFNPNDEEALHNMTVMQAFRGQMTDAWASAEDLMNRGYRNSQMVILKGLLALNWPDHSTQAGHVNQAMEELSKEIGSSYELRFEKTLLLLNLRLQTGQMDEVVQILQSMWNSDPFDSRNFVQPLAVDQQIISWDRLSPLCDSVVRSVPDHEGASALSAICSYMKGDTTLALQKIAEARKRLSQSSLLSAIESLLFFKVGRIAESKVLLRLANNEALGHLVMGQICQAEKDWVCAEKEWMQVLASDSKNPMGLYGQALVAKQRGNDNGAREQIRKAMLISPRYRPLLEAKGDSGVF